MRFSQGLQSVTILHSRYLSLVPSDDMEILQILAGEFLSLRYDMHFHRNILLLRNAVAICRGLIMIIGSKTREFNVVGQEG